MKFSILILTILSSIMMMGAEIPKEAIEDVGVFIWDVESLNDQAYTFMENESVNKVYLHIESSKDKMLYLENIYKLKSEGIQVYALTGGPEWVLESSDKSLTDFFKWLSDYQQAGSETTRLDGIVLDIEPYILDRSDKQEEKDYKRLQDIFVKAKFISDQNGWDLKVVMPFWYDGVELSNIYGDVVLSEWIIENFEDPIIMAYRNVFDGTNGIRDIIENEVLFTQHYGKSLTIALETKASKEGDHISFYDKDRDEMERIAGLIHSFGRDKKININIAVHYLDTWMELQ